jgi:prepilin-type N-terminal cleavage/methylation domain-containing protein
MDVREVQERVLISQISRPAGDAGYTLLELLVAMSLLSLVAVAVMVWVPDLSDRAAVDGAANLLERELSRVSATASREGHDQTAAVRGLGSAVAFEIGGKAFEIDPRIRIRWTAARETGTNEAEGLIVFWGRGGASGGTFELSRGRRLATIEVDWLTARVRRLR